MLLVLWNSNTLRLSEPAAPRTLRSPRSRRRCRAVRRPFGVRALRDVEARGARQRGCPGANGSRSTRCRELFGASWYRGFLEAGAGGSSELLEPCLRSRGVGALRGSWRRGSWVEVSRAPWGCGCFGLRGVMVWKVAWGSRVRRLFGVRGPDSLDRAALAWLKEQVPGRLESSSRSAASETRWPSSWRSARWRRDVRASGRARATEGSSEKRHERLLLVSGGSGREETWRSREDEEGSGRWSGLTAYPAARDSARSKASKSRSEICGSRFVGERASHQRQGGITSRGGKVLCRAAKPLNVSSPQGGCGMKQAHELQRGANRREAESA